MSHGFGTIRTAEAESAAQRLKLSRVEGWHLRIVLAVLVVYWRRFLCFVDALAALELVLDGKQRVDELAQGVERRRRCSGADGCGRGAWSVGFEG